MVLQKEREPRKLVPGFRCWREDYLPKGGHVCQFLLWYTDLRELQTLVGRGATAGIFPSIRTSPCFRKLIHFGPSRTMVHTCVEIVGHGVESEPLYG